MRTAWLLLSILTCLVGCGVVTSTQKVDFAPFAENTISLAADIEYGLTETSRSIHLREYWDTPAVVAHRKEWEKVRVLMKGVVAYSVEVTTLGNSTLSGPARARALADFLDPLARPVITRPGTRFRITAAGLDSMLVDIREQKKLLDGLRAAQPIIDEVDRIAGEIFDEVKASLDVTARELIQSIDEANAAPVKWNKIIHEKQYEKYEALSALGRYVLGEEDALAEFYEIDPWLQRYVANPDTLTADEMQKLEDRLLLKIRAYQEFTDQIQPDLDKYAIQQQEIADLYTDANHQLKRARTTMTVWARSHRNLAQGITDPAKVNLFDITKKAIKTAL
jgi:hypothetical protein